MMVAILVSIISWVIRLITSPEAKVVVDVMGGLMASLPKDMPARAFVLIKEAAALDASTEARFSYVFDGLKSAYPDVAENTVRALIELAYGAWKKGLN